MALHTKKRIEVQSRELPEARTTREDLFRVKEKIINTPLPNNENEQGTRGTTHMEETDHQSEETLSTISKNSMDVPAINFKLYLGATGVKHTHMGQVI